MPTAYASKGGTDYLNLAPAPALPLLPCANP